MSEKEKRDAQLKRELVFALARYLRYYNRLDHQEPRYGLKESVEVSRGIVAITNQVFND